MRLDDRRIAVTGSARGIGEALALGLAEAGAAVACVDIDGEGAGRTAARIDRAGGVAVPVTADLTRVEDVQESLARVVSALGGVDGVVANAGGSQGDSVPFLELDQQRWETMLDRNLTTAFLTGLVYARHLAEHGGGAMVFTSSQLSEAVRPGLSHYCAAKGAIRQLVRAAAVDLAPHGIRVNAVAPGPTITDANRELFARPEVREANERLIPLGRLGEPPEMVGAVVYLLSDAASYTTGTTLFVDGGYTVV